MNVLNLKKLISIKEIKGIKKLKKIKKTKKIRKIKKITGPLFIFLSLLFLPLSAFATEIGMNAWETILTKIANSFTGPVAYAMSIIAMVLCGLVMAFADLQGGAKRFVQAACGLSIAFFAAQIVTNFLGFSGAVI